MKNIVEKVVFVLLLAPLAPLAGFMAVWALAYTFVPENWIPAAALCGFLAGILADFFILKKLLHQVHQLGWIFWMIILIFYSVGMFGLFMGVPVFNTALSVPAGFVMGTRLASEKADTTRVRKMTRKACLVTTALLAVICIASAYFALTSPSTPADLEGMLGLGFSLTQAMIWGIILVGGMGLLAVNWVLTGLSTRITFRFFN